jgi:FMN reductase
VDEERRAMTRYHVVAISGSTRRPSRSRLLAETIAAAVPLSLNLAIYDLVDAGRGLGAAYKPEELPGPALDIVHALETADAIIAAAPVYRGSYPGLFKHLFDLVDPTALQNRPVLIAATGGGQRHALVVEHQLRPLFGFFTALTVPTAVYASDDEFRDGMLAATSTLERVSAAARQLAALMERRKQPAALEQVA